MINNHNFEVELSTQSIECDFTVGQGKKGDKGDKGDTPSITHLETAINDKINEANATIEDIEGRFNSLSPDQSTNVEVQLARTDAAGVVHESLNDRLMQMETNGLIIWETVEG